MAKSRLDLVVSKFIELNRIKTSVQDIEEKKRLAVIKFVEESRAKKWSERRIDRAVKKKFNIQLKWQ